MVKELLGCCGLDCEKCDARLATINNDDGLRRKTAELWSKLNNVEITPEMINCTGCRLDGVKTPFCGFICPIRKCVMGKGLATCADCKDVYECATLGTIRENNPDVMGNLMGQ